MPCLADIPGDAVFLVGVAHEVEVVSRLVAVNLSRPRLLRAKREDEASSADLPWEVEGVELT